MFVSFRQMAAPALNDCTQKPMLLAMTLFMDAMRGCVRSKLTTDVVKCGLLAPLLLTEAAQGAEDEP